MLENKSIIRVGVIGLGNRIFEILRLLLEETDHVCIHAVSDPDVVNVTRAREQLSADIQVFEDYRSMLADPEIDWVVIGSWNCFHAEHIIAALDAGKHVFSEKPLATTLEDCREIEAAVRKSDCMFSFGLVLRYSLFYQRLRAIIEEMPLGKILSFEFNETLHPNHGGYIMGNWRRLRENAGTHLLEKCCHDFDLANWMMDSVPVRVASFGGNDIFRPENAALSEKLGKNSQGKLGYMTWADHNLLNPFTAEKSVVDNQVVIMEYANGARASFHTNMHSTLPERRFYIMGTEGSVRGDVLTGTIEWARIAHEPDVVREQIDGHGMHGGGDIVLVRSLIDSMLNGTLPHAGIDEALKSAIACMSVDQALDSGETVDCAHLYGDLLK
ncbi:Gfo/Idh/MocA family oxidoreductase [Coraliomargarita sp. SDUM461004]|uniref:Gfo/Idh/MocA family oxidoreductase n=1 Tax=Thalassobacterium sedimentorum TaxID=3041258 RepID=A0ABU1AE24_9BACT|nr:Gfo/Idh/MocA family oxidoreductase [Coraliomargarita sp. SDUM461004]MDQ8192999.1 Gfo/Idh/MocA family oxidoreductase [Coraliomargarita sp. SDUM461004]